MFSHKRVPARSERFLSLCESILRCRRARTRDKPHAGARRSNAIAARIFHLIVAAISTPCFVLPCAPKYAARSLRGGTPIRRTLILRATVTVQLHQSSSAHRCLVHRHGAAALLVLLLT
jgi:hypothetical protein